MNQLTEENAVMIFAKAWNHLEPGEFLALLSPDACYAFQWFFEELIGAVNSQLKCPPLAINFNPPQGGYSVRNTDRVPSF